MGASTKFLVIQQKMIGDVLASTIICQALKHYYPSAKIHMVANENTLQVLENNPFIDKIVIFKEDYRSNRLLFFRFLLSLKKINYTAVLDAYGKLESNLISLFARADQKISNYKWYTSWVYSHTINQKHKAMGEIPLSISNRLLLINPLKPKTTFSGFPKLYLSKVEVNSGREVISKIRDYKTQKTIMISILGSSRDKSYPAAYMAEILDVICNHSDVKLIFNYLPEQKADALKIYRLCNEHAQKRIDETFYANSLRSYIAIVSQCDLVIGNEGGAINMAKAVEVPTFSIFSPIIPKGNWHGSIYKNHDGVHLYDYMPEIFGRMNKKQLRKNSLALYQKLRPELFKDRLCQFLDVQLGTSQISKNTAL